MKKAFNKKNSHLSLAICHSSRRRSGFTLLELLIVLAILGVLTSIVVVAYPASQKRARDAKRKSDIKQYQTAVETYANRRGTYPVSGGNVIVSGSYCSGAANLALPVCPSDSKSGWNYYINSTASDYRIWSRLEEPNSLQLYFYVCSSGESGQTTTDPASTNPC